MIQIKKPGKRSIISGLVWMLTYFGSLMLLTRVELSQSVAIAVAIVPIVTFIIFVYSYIKGVAAMDEVKQRVQFEAVVIAFSLSLLTVMSLFLFGMAVELNYNYFGYHNLVLYFIIFYYIGYIISKKKYQI